MTEMVNMQEKNSQNNIAKEISKGKLQQFTKLFFRHLKASWNEAEEEYWRGRGGSVKEVRNQKTTEDKTHGPTAAP